MKNPKTSFTFPFPLALAAVLLVASGQAQTWAQSLQRSNWGVVLGADNAISGAMKEANNAAKKLGVIPRIYKCGNWFRTIAVFPDKRQANAYLSKAQLETNYNPYIVDMMIWCPRKSLVSTQISGEKVAAPQTIKR